jgi:hypothetical protein
MRAKLAASLGTAFIAAAGLTPMAQAADVTYPPAVNWVVEQVTYPPPCPPEPIIQMRNGTIYLVIPLPLGCNHLVIPIPTNFVAPQPPPL